MHEEILTKKQQELLPLVQSFSKNFGLVGGTAVALHIGHRESIDFDLFSYDEFNNQLIRRNVMKLAKIDKVLVNRSGEYTFFSNDVKITFFNYPFKIKYSRDLDKIIKLPDLLTLAAMKAYALGQRAKWKDYVDLYFIINKYHSVNKIIKESKEIFGNEFNEKIFKSQLSYFDDINYKEEIIFRPGYEVAEKKIKKELIDFSLS